MPVGYYAEGKTRHILECRDAEGRCYYRKFTDEDRLSYLFARIPETECGKMFRARPVLTERDKRAHLIHDKWTARYLSQMLMLIQGKNRTPERRRNRAKIEAFNRRGVVHRTHKDFTQMDLRRLLEDETDPLDKPGMLKPKNDPRLLNASEIEELGAVGSLPAQEKAPAEFDMAAWLRGEFETPDDAHLDGAEPQTPDTTIGGAAGFNPDNQYVKRDEMPVTRDDGKTALLEGKAPAAVQERPTLPKVRQVAAPKAVKKKPSKRKSSK